MAKHYTTTALSILLLVISFTASASSHHVGCGLCGGCDPYDPPQGCDQTEQYNESFTTTSFTEDKFHNKYYFNFDAIQEPGDGFEIESVFLTVNTNSNGIGDYIWAKVDSYHWDEVGKLSSSGADTFELDESLFDLVMNGIEFKAGFGKSSEYITLATLTVNGKYCATPVPLPSAVWLFGSAFAGLIGFGGRRRERS